MMINDQRLRPNNFQRSVVKVPFNNLSPCAESIDHRFCAKTLSTKLLNSRAQIAFLVLRPGTGLIINRFHAPTTPSRIFEENPSFSVPNPGKAFSSPRSRKGHLPLRIKNEVLHAPIRLIIKLAHRLPYKSSNRNFFLKKLRGVRRNKANGERKSRKVMTTPQRRAFILSVLL